MRSYAALNNQVQHLMANQIDDWLTRTGRIDYRRWQQQQPELATISFDRFAAHLAGDLTCWFEGNGDLDDAVMRSLMALGRTNDIAALIVICTICHGELASPAVIDDVPGFTYSAIHNRDLHLHTTVRWSLRRYVLRSITPLKPLHAELLPESHPINDIDDHLAVSVSGRYAIGQLLSEATANSDPQTLLLAMAVFYDGDSIASAARSLDMSYAVAQQRIQRLRNKLSEHISIRPLATRYTAANSNVARPPKSDVAQKSKQCTLAASVPEAASPFVGIPQ